MQPAAENVRGNEQTVTNPVATFTITVNISGQLLYSGSCVRLLHIHYLI